MNVQNQVSDFIKQVTGAMGLSVNTSVEKTPDGFKVNIDGAGAETLLVRRGEPLKALQHLVDTAFRRDLGESRAHIDCMGYRRDKDAELQQMARFLIEKVKQTGTEQEMGPLNPYERRLVHLAVADDPAVVSESIGDAHVKTVIISLKR
jgi:spoIIIJ-associated protein